MKKKWMILVAVLATVLLCVGFAGCEDPDNNANMNSDQATTQPTTQPDESTTTGGGTIPEPPGPDSGVAERNPTKPTDPTDPSEEPEVPEDPTPPAGGETPDTPDIEEMTYKKYEALSEEEKMAFQGKFASRKAFLNWYKTAKQEYEDSQHKVTIGPGAGLDIGDYM